MDLTDPEAIVVSTTSRASDDPVLVIASNISFINALLAEHVRITEVAVDAVRSYYVDYFYAQMMNGGFSQFVYNSRWNPVVVDFVRTGLAAMGAKKELTAFNKGARFVDQAGEAWRAAFLARAYFGDNLHRDAYNDALGHKPFVTLQESNARWLRTHPKLVVATVDDMAAEVARRGRALPDRAARIAAARAAEPRDLRLVRALCEKAGHVFDRRTAASLVDDNGQRVWGYFFLTDRGPHLMIDRGDRAVMFAYDDRATVIAEVDAAPEHA